MKEIGRDRGIQLGLRLGTSEIKIAGLPPTDYHRNRAKAYIAVTLIDKAQEQDPVIATFGQTTWPSDLQAVRALVEECQALNIPLKLTEHVTDEIFNESGRIPLASEFVVSLITPSVR